MAKTLLEVKNLSKKYGDFLAVDKVSFKLHEGEVLGLLGPNGAGKTTTIQMLLGTTTKTSGSIKYFGKTFEENRSEILEKVNFGSAYDYLPWRLTVWENLQVYARLYGVSNRKDRIEKLLTEFKIGKFKDTQVMSLSAGQKTRLILCKAFINYPKVILLDEPTASLDPEIAAKVRKFVVEQQRRFGVAVLFTSHNMAEVTEVCDRVMFLKKGKIVAEDTPEGLARKIKSVTLELLVGDGLKRTRAFAEENKLEVEVDNKFVRIGIKEKEISKFLVGLADKGICYSEISIKKPTLEDYFLQMTKEENEKP